MKHHDETVQLNNLSFNSIEFDGIKNQAGLNSFIRPQAQASAIYANDADRLAMLNSIAITQMRTLLTANDLKHLKRTR